MTEQTPEAVAFIDWGRWVADCPHPGCTNAKLITPGQDMYVCDAPPDNKGACLRSAPIVWPDAPGAILAGLSGRPESQQSWRPEPAGEEMDNAAEHA